MDLKVLFEATKEPLRLAVLSIIPLALVYFETLSFEWAAVAVVVLRFIDKLLHEVEASKPVKEQNEGLLGVKGLTGF